MMWVSTMSCGVFRCPSVNVIDKSYAHDNVKLPIFPDRAVGLTNKIICQSRGEGQESRQKLWVGETRNYFTCQV